MTKEVVSVSNLMRSKSVTERLDEILGEKRATFVSSVLQAVNGNSMLKNADPATVLNAAITAATLDLPINNNLGFAYIIPYNNNKNINGRWEKVVEAQFQLGYKGFVQLAIRSSQYHRINAVTVYENQFKGWNELTEELDADFNVQGKGKAAGYVAYFRLINGFEKFVFWPHEKVIAHAKKFSKSWGKKKSVWSDMEGGFEAMALKTVLKNSLSKWGILSVELQTAITFDQSTQYKEGSPEYIDNGKELSIEEKERENQRKVILEHIEEAADIQTLIMVADHVDEYDCREEYEFKIQFLGAKNEEE